ncbi:MAG: hypothetical protein DRO06_03820, partial [Thermoproteota archaeon]
MALAGDVLDWLESEAEPPFSVMTHGEDLDGLASAAMMLGATGGAVTITFATPRFAASSARGYDVVLDLPAPRGGVLLYVDHHASNLRYAERAVLAFVRPEYPSTASLLRDLLEEALPGKLRRLADLASMADTGEGGEEAAIFNSVARRLLREGRSRLSWIVSRLAEDPPGEIRDLVKIPEIKREWKRIETEYTDVLSEIKSLRGVAESVGPRSALIVVAAGVPGFLSPMILHSLRGARGLVILARPSSPRISVRSGPEARVSALELAEVSGGGGHERAAAVRLGPGGLESLEDSLRRAGLTVRRVTVGGRVK